MIFFCFSKIFGFGVFLVHPTVVSVLLSASVERFFVSCMRDFFYIFFLSCLRGGWGLFTKSVKTKICERKKKSSNVDDIKIKTTSNSLHIHS